MVGFPKDGVEGLGEYLFLVGSPAPTGDKFLNCNNELGYDDGYNGEIYVLG